MTNKTILSKEIEDKIYIILSDVLRDGNDTILDLAQKKISKVFIKEIQKAREEGYNQGLKENCIAIDKHFLEEIKPELKGGDLLRDMLKKAERKGAMEIIDDIIDLISIHTEKDGSYCDTGEDMEWSCRSECVAMAIKRIKSKYNK